MVRPCTRSASQNIDANKTASVQQVGPGNQQSNVDPEPAIIPNRAGVVTRAEFNELIRENLERRRQLNEQIQANANLMTQIAQHQNQNVEGSPAPYSLSDSLYSSDEHPRRRHRIETRQTEPME